MKVSVLIPTYNGARTLPRLLARLQPERSRGVEVVAVDSGSQDETLALLRDGADKVLHVGPEGFNHGATRNHGISECNADLVVLMVQDAEPADEHWLDALTAPFKADQRVAGTYARQLARPDASIITRSSLERWIAASPLPRTQSLAADELEHDSTSSVFNRLTPMDRYLRCVFDNVCSCLRKSVWAELPFRRTSIAEDVAWAKDVLLAGHQLTYTADARVIHSHERDARYEFWRTYLVHQQLRQLFGLETIPDAPSLGLAVTSTLRDHLQCLLRSDAGLTETVKQAPRAMALAVAWPIGQYLGAKSVGTPILRFRPKGV